MTNMNRYESIIVQRLPEEIRPIVIGWLGPPCRNKNTGCNKYVEIRCILTRVDEEDGEVVVDEDCVRGCIEKYEPYIYGGALPEWLTRL